MGVLWITYGASQTYIYSIFKCGSFKHESVTAAYTWLAVLSLLHVLIVNNELSDLHCVAQAWIFICS